MGGLRDLVAGMLASVRRPDECRFPLEGRASFLHRDAALLRQATLVLSSLVAPEAGLRADQAQQVALAHAPLAEMMNAGSPSTLGPLTAQPEATAADVATVMRSDRDALLRLAESVDGAGLRDEVRGLLDAAPVPPTDAPLAELVPLMGAALDEHEAALLLCAERLDAVLT